MSEMRQDLLSMGRFSPLLQQPLEKLRAQLRPRQSRKKSRQLLRRGVPFLKQISPHIFLGNPNFKVRVLVI